MIRSIEKDIDDIEQKYSDKLSDYDQQIKVYMEEIEKAKTKKMEEEREHFSSLYDAAELGNECSNNVDDLFVNGFPIVRDYDDSDSPFNPEYVIEYKGKIVKKQVALWDKKRGLLPNRRAIDTCVIEIPASTQALPTRFTFEVDNYLNLYFKRHGIYLMFNKISYPLVAFQMNHKYKTTQINYLWCVGNTNANKKLLYDVFTDRISVSELFKNLSACNSLVPSNFDRVNEFYHRFRKLSGYKKSKQLKTNNNEKNSKPIKIPTEFTKEPWSFSPDKITTRDFLLGKIKTYIFENKLIRGNNLQTRLVDTTSEKGQILRELFNMDKHHILYFKHLEKRLDLLINGGMYVDFTYLNQKDYEYTCMLPVSVTPKNIEKTTQQSKKDEPKNNSQNVEQSIEQELNKTDDTSEDEFELAKTNFKNMIYNPIRNKIISDKTPVKAPPELLEAPWGCDEEIYFPKGLLCRMILDFINEHCLFNEYDIENDNFPLDTSGKYGYVIKRLFHMKVDEKLFMNNFIDFFNPLFDRENLVTLDEYYSLYPDVPRPVPETFCCEPWNYTKYEECSRHALLQKIYKYIKDNNLIKKEDTLYQVSEFYDKTQNKTIDSVIIDDTLRKVLKLGKDTTQIFYSEIETCLNTLYYEKYYFDKNYQQFNTTIDKQQETDDELQGKKIIDEKLGEMTDDALTIESDDDVFVNESFEIPPVYIVLNRATSGDSITIPKHMLGCFSNYKDAKKVVKAFLQKNGKEYKAYNNNLKEGIDVNGNQNCGEIEAYVYYYGYSGERISIYKCNPQ